MTVVCTKCGVVSEGRPDGKCPSCGAEWALIPAWRAQAAGPSATELHAEAVAHLTERRQNGLTSIDFHGRVVTDA